MSENTKLRWFALALVAVLLFLGYVLGWGITRSIYRVEAVEHGAAEYNRQSGDWEWTEHED